MSIEGQHVLLVFLGASTHHVCDTFLVAFGMRMHGADPPPPLGAFLKLLLIVFLLLLLRLPLPYSTHATCDAIVTRHARTIRATRCNLHASTRAAPCATCSAQPPLPSPPLTASVVFCRHCIGTGTHRLYIGSISASPTACPLRGYGRAGTQNDRLSEAVILTTISVRWTCRRGCRDRADIEPI